MRAFLSKTRKRISGSLNRRFNGAAVVATIGAVIFSASVAMIYRPAGGMLLGLFLILAALDMRR